MSAITRYFSALALVSTCLFPIAAMSGAPSARNQSRELMVHTDEVTVRELTAKYYYAFESYGLDVQAAMWSPNSKDPAAKPRDKMRMQAAMTPPKIEKLDIWRVSVDGDRAIVLAKVLMTTFLKSNGKPVGGWYNRDVSFRHTFVKENEGWKLLEIEFRADDLMKAVIKSRTDVERDLIRYEFSDLSVNEQVDAFQSGAWEVERSQPDPARALALIQYAYRLAEQLGDRERTGEMAASLAHFCTYVGDHGQALIWQYKALEFEEEQQEKGNVPNALNSIGFVYSILEEPALAAEYFQKSIAATAARKSPSTLQRELRVSGNLAKSYIDLGDTVKARQIYERLLSLAENDKDKTAVVVPLAGLGAVHQAEGRYSEALEAFARALKANETSRDRGRDQSLTKALAQVNLLKGDYAQAAIYARRAIELALSRGIKDLAWDAYLIEGRAAIAMHQYAKAKASFEEAISIVEAMGDRSIGNEETRQQFMCSKVSAYQAMVELLLLEGDEISAFTYAERAKARILLNVITSERRGIQKSMSAAEKQEETKLIADSLSADSAVERAKGDPATPAVKLEELTKAAGTAKLAHAAFRSRLYVERPDLRISRGEITPLAIDDTMPLLFDRKGALLEFTVTDGRAFVFVITRGPNGRPSLKTFTVDMGAKELGKRVQAYRSRIASGDLDFQRQSRELYDLLLKPAQAQLAGKTNLIIVPDGPLWDLPFQALQDEIGKYLVEKTAVSYAPSLTALREMSKKAKTRKPDAGLELLAFGNPIVGKGTAERVQRVFMSEKLEPIPEAERLVKELGKMYGPRRSKVFTGGDAREEVAKTESPKYRIVQFATHGILNNVSPMYSHLVLAQNETNPNEDGLLEAWELKDLDLNADMVILSACETARGRISNGEGMIGMTWASFIAGAPTTVASQWKVESSSTTELMLEFHRQLLAKQRVSKAEALRRASLKLMKMPKYRHPSYWAGFVLVGDGS